MGCRRNGLSEKWVVGEVGFVGEVGCQINGLSEKWVVGEVGCRRSRWAPRESISFQRVYVELSFKIRAYLGQPLWEYGTWQWGMRSTVILMSVLNGVIQNKEVRDGKVVFTNCIHLFSLTFIHIYKKRQSLFASIYYILNRSLCHSYTFLLCFLEVFSSYSSCWRAREILYSLLEPHAAFSNSYCTV